MESGAGLIAAERQRQVEQEGWTAEHDDSHGETFELVRAAECYLHAGLSMLKTPQALVAVARYIGFRDDNPTKHPTYTAMADDPLAMFYGRREDGGVEVPSSLSWPWEESAWKPTSDPIPNLVKAGALIAAEIDRIQRERAREGS